MDKLMAFTTIESVSISRPKNPSRLSILLTIDTRLNQSQLIGCDNVRSGGNGFEHCTRNDSSK